MVWLPVLRILNMYACVDACSHIWELYDTESWPWETLCCTEESISPQYCTWPFAQMLYQMSHVIFTATDQRDVSLTVSAWYFCFAADTTSKVISGRWAVCSMNCWLSHAPSKLRYVFDLLFWMSQLVWSCRCLCFHGGVLSYLWFRVLCFTPHDDVTWVVDWACIE